MTTTPASWGDVKPGAIITVTKSYSRRSFKIEVVEVEQGNEAMTYRFVTGRRLRMDGRASTARRRSQPMHLVRLTEITDMVAPAG